MFLHLLILYWRLRHLAARFISASNLEYSLIKSAMVSSCLEEETLQDAQDIGLGSTLAFLMFSLYPAQKLFGLFAILVYRRMREYILLSKIGSDTTIWRMMPRVARLP